VTVFLEEASLKMETEPVPRMQCYIHIHKKQKLQKSLRVQTPYAVIRTLKNCIRFEAVPHPSYSLTSGCLQLSRIMSKKLISHVMKKTRVVAGKMVLRTAREVLKRQVSKTRSALAALYRMSVRQRTWEMEYGNKVLIRISSLRCVSLQ